MIVMNKRVFRKNSIDKISSPEQLNEYIRVSNPGVWFVLAAIIILLAGVCVWGFLGRLDTKLKTVSVVENSEMTLYVKAADIASVETGMKVIINDKEYEIADIATEPVSADGSFNEYTLHVGDLQKGEWVYPVMVEGDLTDGIYTAEIVTESISPISFVIN